MPTPSRWPPAAGLAACLALLLSACGGSPPAAAPAAPAPARPGPGGSAAQGPPERRATPGALAQPIAPAGGAPPQGPVRVEASAPLRGTLLDDDVDSPIIGERLRYRVYLPPRYATEDRRYPVLYMLHGAGGDYTEWSDSFLPERADELIERGEIPQLIVVMPNSGGATYWANWSDDGPRWADYVATDVVRTVDARYRTIPDAGSRAIGGLSMGGLGALNIALQHPEIFGVVGGHSPSIRLEPDPALWFLAGDNFYEHSPLWLVQHRRDAERLTIWLDVGTDDVWRPNVEVLRDALLEQDLPPTWGLFPGVHEAEYWIEHVPDYLHFYTAALRAGGPSERAAPRAGAAR